MQDLQWNACTLYCLKRITNQELLLNALKYSALQLICIYRALHFINQFTMFTTDTFNRWDMKFQPLFPNILRFHTFRLLGMYML